MNMFRLNTNQPLYNNKNNNDPKNMAILRAPEGQPSNGQVSGALGGVLAAAEQFSPLSYQDTKGGGKVYRPDGKVSGPELIGYAQRATATATELEQKAAFLEKLTEQGYLDSDATATAGEVRLDYDFRTGMDPASHPGNRFAREGGNKVPPKTPGSRFFAAQYGPELSGTNRESASQQLSENLLRGVDSKAKPLNFEDTNGDGNISNGEVISALKKRANEENANAQLANTLGNNASALAQYDPGSQERTFLGFGPQSQYVSRKGLEVASNTETPGNRAFFAALQPTLIASGRLQQEPAPFNIAGKFKPTTSQDANSLSSRIASASTGTVGSDLGTTTLAVTPVPGSTRNNQDVAER
jgi:hypothetical protein